MIEGLQMELMGTYSDLTDIARRQRILNEERVEVEATRDIILKEIAKVAVKNGV